MLSFFNNRIKKEPKTNIIYCENNQNYFFYQDDGNLLFIQIYHSSYLQYYQKELSTLSDDIAEQSVSDSLLVYRSLKKKLDNEMLAKIKAIVDIEKIAEKEQQIEVQKFSDQIETEFTLSYLLEETLEESDTPDPRDDHSEAGDDEETTELEYNPLFKPMPGLYKNNVKLISGRYRTDESEKELVNTALLRQLR